MSFRELRLRMLPSLLLVFGFGWHMSCSAAAQSFTSASLAGLVDSTTGSTLGVDPYKGKYRLVLFGFTSCADVCPLTLMALRESMMLLGSNAARVVPIFISVDPDRDQGERLAKYVRAFDPRIKGLTGPSAVLAKVAAGHGVFFEKRWVNVSNNVYVFDHTASVLLIGPDGKLIATVSSVGTPAEVAQRIATAFPRVPAEE